MDSQTFFVDEDVKSEPVKLGRHKCLDCGNTRAFSIVIKAVFVLSPEGEMKFAKPLGEHLPQCVECGGTNVTVNDCDVKLVQNERRKFEGKGQFLDMNTGANTWTVTNDLVFSIMQDGRVKVFKGPYAKDYKRPFKIY